MTVLYLMLRHVFKLTLTAYEQKILKIIQLATSHNNIVLNSRKSNFPLMQIKARLKVYLAFYQIIIAAPYVLNMRFPKLFYNLSGPFTFLNFNLLQDSGSSCSLFPNMDYVDVLMFSTLAPFVMACVVFSIMFLHISYNRYIKHFSSSTDVRQSYYQGFLIFLYFALPAISTMIFRTFRYVHIASFLLLFLSLMQFYFIAAVMLTQITVLTAMTCTWPQITEYHAVLIDIYLL